MSRSTRHVLCAIAIAVGSAWAAQTSLVWSDPPPNPGGLSQTESNLRADAIDAFYLGAAPAIDEAGLAISSADGYMPTIASLESTCDLYGIPFPDLTPYYDELDDLGTRSGIAQNLADLGDGVVQAGDDITSSIGLRQAQYTAARIHYDTPRLLPTT